MRLFILLAFITGLTLFAALAQAADPSLPLATIIQRTIDRDEANQKQLHAMEYHEAIKTEQLGTDGKVAKQQDIQMIIRPGATDEITVLSVKGDDIPSDPDAAAKKAKGEVAKRQNMRFALKDMVQRFKITLAGTDILQGQPVYLLAFEPKLGQPYQDQTEKVLNNLHGKLWVRVSDFSILKTDANLAQPVDVAWVLAQVTTLHFHYELHAAAGEMGPASVQTFVVVSAPFISFQQRMKIDMTQFRARTHSVTMK